MVFRNKLPFCDILSVSHISGDWLNTSYVFLSRQHHVWVKNSTLSTDIGIKKYGWLIEIIESPEMRAKKLAKMACGWHY